MIMCLYVALRKHLVLTLFILVSKVYILPCIVAEEIITLILYKHCQADNLELDILKS